MAKKSKGRNKRNRAPAPALEPNGPLLQGIVIRSVGSSTRVKTQTGAIYECSISGKFRIQGLKTTNPVAVGDEVKFTATNETEGVIRKILPRKNYILRRAIIHAHKVHILAANIDQAILLFTVNHPVTSTGFADRFLVTAEAYHIPTKIIINKIDQIESEEDKARLKEITEIYENIGYEVSHVSAVDPAYKEAASNLLVDKVSFIGGHSGAGKSTLINLVDPDLNIKTSEISIASNKGVHTTTYAEMHPLVTGGYIIDSPGIKELGIIDFEKQDLAHYFPEIRALISDCKFNNCIHIKEPGCAVKAAIEAGEISQSRYTNYLRMMEETADGWSG